MNVPASDDETLPSEAAESGRSSDDPPAKKRSWYQRQKRRARRRSFRFTREGKVFVAVTIGVGLAAVNTGNNLLYLVLGLLLSLLLVSGMLSDLALWGVRMKRRFPDRIFAGESALFEVALTNTKGKLPSYAVEVEDLAVGEVAASRRCFFLKIRPKDTQTATYRRTAERRGMLKMDRYIVRTRYPFGLLEKGQRFESEDEMLVFPQLLERRLLLAQGATRGEEQAGHRAGHGTEVLGLREHRAGDEARSVHWRRSAALDRLIVRENARDAKGRVAILIDRVIDQDAEDAQARLDAFEQAIREAATLVRDAIDAGLSVQILTQGLKSQLAESPAGRDALWRFLALLEAQHEAGEMPDAPQGTTALIAGRAA